jgi:O-antigen ligase
MFDVWTLSQGSSRIINALAVIPNYLYWVLTIMIFASNYTLINFKVVYKASTIAIIFCIAYYFIPFFKPLEKTFLFKGLPDNIFAFILIAFTPISLSYIKGKYGITLMIFAGIGLVSAAFLGGSRSGSILVLLNFVILTVYYLRNSLLIYFSVALLIIIYLLYFNYESYVKKIVYELNPRTYDLLYEENILEEDHSYLTRLALREKGIYLFEKSPITGVGINNFGSVEGEIEYNFTGGDIVERDDEHIKRASAHNSYISILTETGLLGSIPLALFIIYILLRCLYLGTFKKDEQSFVLVIGLIGMLIHFNFISAILNIYTWFYFGLVAANNQRFNKKNEIRHTLPYTTS